MRLIDADELTNLPFERMIHTDWGDTAIPIEEIDNAPTIENKYHEGYTQGYIDGKTSAETIGATWIYKDYGYNCSNCNNRALELEDYPYLSRYCPFCGAEMEIEN